MASELTQDLKMCIIILVTLTYYKTATGFMCYKSDISNSKDLASGRLINTIPKLGCWTYISRIFSLVCISDTDCI